MIMLNILKNNCFPIKVTAFGIEIYDDDEQP
jgi:hypothetical protein